MLFYNGILQSLIVPCSSAVQIRFICTGTLTPNVGRMIQNGFRPPKPSFLPESLYAMMMKCWNPTRSLRPSFSDIKVGEIYQKFFSIKLNVLYGTTSFTPVL